MKRIATVNGVHVYSDKQLTRIDGSHLTFTDGSTCDVDTNSIHNKGPGTIRIDVGGDRHEASETSAVKGPTRFPTSELHLSSLSANLTVSVWDQSGMELKLDGPKDALEAITTKAKGKTLCIDGGDWRGTRGNRGQNGGSISIVGGIIGSVVVSGGKGGSSSAADDVNITIMVPPGTSVTLDDVSGDTKIGDVGGDLDATLKGSSKIRCGSVRNAAIAISGSADLRINEVIGRLDGAISGSGDIKVKSGTVTALNVSISGSGSFDFGGVADTAKLAISGSGRINVGKVKGNCIKHCTGSGKINVG